MNSEDQHHIDLIGMPFVPGIACGVLQDDLAQATSHDIVILSQDEIESLTRHPAGIIVIEGAAFSHAMIRLLGMGVPMVIVDRQQAAKLKPGQKLLLDGRCGHISSDLRVIDSVADENHVIGIDKPLATRDGVEVHLYASVRHAHAARQAVLAGGSAIGLVRSEFFMPPQGQLPDAAFYYQAFKEVCEAAAPLNVTIRLLDLAPDKLPAWLPQFGETNSVLGYQGVRLYGIEPVRQVVLAQLEAIDRLSEQFALRLLLPYLVRHEELRYWIDWIQQHLSAPIPIGAMVETPASALDMANWFDSTDFVAIGCNDLMQCLFATDRCTPGLHAYLDPYAPLLYRFFRQMAEAAKDHLQQIQLCGVLSQLPDILPILLGLGYRNFSVEASSIPYLARRVASIDIDEAEKLAQRVCAALESRQVLDILGLKLASHTSFLIP